jgi:hypothetical protein
MVNLSIFLGVLRLQQEWLRWWRDGLCDGSGLNDLEKENLTNNK